MSIGDWFELTLEQTYMGEVMFNVWSYEQTAGGAAGAASLATAFQASVMDDLEDCQITGVVYTRVLAQNLTNILDNAEDTTPTPSGGLNAGEGTPLPLALKYRSSRPDLSRKYSFKAIGGFPLDFLVNGLIDTTIPAITNLASAMISTITSAGNTFKPVQLRRVYPGGGLPPVITKNYDITGWNARPQPGTQNTRKQGRGI